jgi:hypothetical protein
VRCETPHADPQECEAALDQEIAFALGRLRRLVERRSALYRGREADREVCGELVNGESDCLAAQIV